MNPSLYTKHPRVILTGREVIFFGDKGRAVLVARLLDLEGSRIYQIDIVSGDSPTGTWDSGTRLRAGQFDSLLELVTDRTPRKFKRWKQVLQKMALVEQDHSHHPKRGDSKNEETGANTERSNVGNRPVSNSGPVTSDCDFAHVPAVTE